MNTLKILEEKIEKLRFERIAIGGLLKATEDQIKYLIKLKKEIEKRKG